MSQNEDLIFVELAMKNGLLTPEQVDELLEMKAKLEGMGLEESISDLASKKQMLSPKDANLLRMKVSPRGGSHQIEGYRLMSRIGRGGMGAVYKAMQLSMDRPVAIKVLKPSLVKDDQQVARLKREAQLIGRLQHVNIVRGLDFGISNGFHYFAMEYVEGQSVKALIEDEGPMEESEALRVVRDVARALEHAHEEGVVHRDIKPANILIGKDGAVKLADYGLAKGPLEDHQLTQSGVTVGTPQYISPEQAKGPSEVDIRSDLYSLGATLYHMVTGRPPYEGETLAHLIQQVLYERYAPPRTLRRDLSPSVDFLIEKLMARQPRHRYQNPAELLADLDAIEASQSIVPAGWQGDFEVYHEKKRLRKVLFALVAVLVLGSISITWILVATNRAREDAENIKAQEQLTALQNVELSKENIQQTIADVKSLIKRHDGRPAADSAEDFLNRLIREKKQLERQNDLRTRVSRFLEEDQWAAALRAIERHRATLPKQDADLGRKEAEEYLVEVSLNRDEWVADELEDEIGKLLDRKPDDALNDLALLLNRLENKSYLESEDRRGLAETVTLKNNLSTAIGKIDWYLSRPGKLLSSEQKRNYAEIRVSLAEALDLFRSDSETEKLLASLPRSWSEDLKQKLLGFDDGIVEANRAEAVAVASQVELLEVQGRFDAALTLYQKLADRSVEEVSGDLAREQLDLDAKFRTAVERVEKSWADFLPVFARRISRREWSSARNLVATTMVDISGLHPNERLKQMESAQMTAGFGGGLEGAFLARVNGMDSIEAGLQFGSVRYAPIFDVTTDPRAGTVTFRFGGSMTTLPVSELAAEDLMRLTARENPEPLTGVLSGLLEWGELEAGGDPRQKHDALPVIVEKILSAGSEESHHAFVEQLAELIRSEQAVLGVEIRAREVEAEDEYRRAEDAFNTRNYQDAHDRFQRLLKSQRLKGTDFVRENKADIKDFIERAKDKLPSVKAADYSGMRVTHVEGSKVGHDYVINSFLDMEDPKELKIWKFNSGRVGIVKVESPRIGPPAPWESPDGDRSVTEHHLRFHTAEKEGDELDRHPLRLESMYNYSRRLSIEFRARWDHPVAMFLSLCGTNVVVLSDTTRIENGRGVHIWQGLDKSISHPDLKVPNELRTTYLRQHPQALKGEDAHHRYFQFEAGRWYRVRFVKGEKLASLYVDDRLILEKEIKQYGYDGKDIVFRTWTPCDLDEMRILGVMDGGWYLDIPRRLKEEGRK